MSDRQTLLEFGFTPEKVEKALKATKESGLQSALDWLETHGDDVNDVTGDNNDTNAANIDEDEETALTNASTAQANSLKCVDCGKIFANSSLASWHGEKSGHSNFEESTDCITPLTAEEKASRLNELRIKMEAKRKDRAIKDAEEAKQNEALRRKGGKDMASIKEEVQLKQVEKEAAQRKRDKLETDKAKARVLRDIEEDKKARAAKAAAEKAKRTGQAMIPEDVGKSSNANQHASVVDNATKASSRTFAEAKLLLRLPSGESLQTIQPSDKPLRSVVEWLLQQPPVLESGVSKGALKLSVTFPRKVFTEVEMGQSLATLGLTPSAVLVVTI